MILDNNGSFSSNFPIYKDLKEFESNLPKTVGLLQTSDGDKVYLIGTAHFSLKSQDDVSFVIRNVLPQAIVLELCPFRIHILQLNEKSLLNASSQITPGKVKQIILEHGLTGGMLYLSFLKTSANITRQLGVAPGGECRRAINEVKQLNLNCRIFLGDRPINITINRAMHGLNWKQKLHISYLLNYLNDTESAITHEEVEKFKDHNVKPIQTLENELPTIYKSFVQERDYILAHSLSTAVNVIRRQNHYDQISSMNNRIVGVVGIGHMPGITNYFGHTTHEQVSEYLKIQRKNWFSSYKNNFTTTNMIATIVKHLRFSLSKWL